MVQTIKLNSNNTANITLDTNISAGKIDVYHNDNLKKIRTTLATLQGGRWSYPTNDNVDAFVRYAKQYPKLCRLVKASQQLLVDGEPTGMSLELKCLKRRFKLQVVKVKRSINHKAQQK